MEIFIALRGLSSHERLNPEGKMSLYNYKSNQQKQKQTTKRFYKLVIITTYKQKALQKYFKEGDFDEDLEL